MSSPGDEMQKESKKKYLYIILEVKEWLKYIFLFLFREIKMLEVQLKYTPFNKCLTCINLH